MLKNCDGVWIDRDILVSYSAPWISLLLFADDCLIFMKADGRSATRLNKILEHYSVGYGQSANKMKSSIFFSSKQWCFCEERCQGCFANTPRSTQGEISWPPQGSRKDYRTTISTHQ